jgi:hypothetical protein
VHAGEVFAEVKPYPFCGLHHSRFPRFRLCWWQQPTEEGGNEEWISTRCAPSSL